MMRLSWCWLYKSRYQSQMIACQNWREWWTCTLARLVLHCKHWDGCCKGRYFQKVLAMSVWLPLGCLPLGPAQWCRWGWGEWWGRQQWRGSVQCTPLEQELCHGGEDKCTVWYSHKNWFESNNTITQWVLLVPSAIMISCNCDYSTIGTNNITV